MTPPAMTSVLDQPVQFVKGVGPKKGDALATAGVSTVGDLLMYVPLNVVADDTGGGKAAFLAHML